MTRWLYRNRWTTRALLCWGLWRCEGYDGEPLTLREAWEIARVVR